MAKGFFLIYCILKTKMRWHASQNCFDGGSIPYFLMKKKLIIINSPAPDSSEKPAALQAFVTLAWAERPQEAPLQA
jgi:hypothetical protein